MSPKRSGRSRGNPAGKPSADADAPVDTTVWIKTEIGPDEKAYVVIVEAGRESVTVTPDRAVKYAHGVLRAAHRAAYDAAVLRQLTTLGGVEREAAVAVVTSLREDRPPLDDEATRPFTMEPGVNEALEPFLTIRLNGKPLGQWEFGAAVKHATTMLAQVSVAELDTGYLQGLMQYVGVDRQIASNMVSDLAKFRGDW